MTAHRRSKLVVWLILLTAFAPDAHAEGFLSRWWNKLTGADETVPIAKTDEAQVKLQADALARLNELTFEEASQCVLISLPKGLLVNMVEKVVPITYSPAGQSWAVELTKLQLEPKWGVLRFSAEASFKTKGLPAVAAELAGHVVAAQGEGRGLNARLSFSSVKPVVPEAPPSWARPVLSGSTLKLLNDRLPAIPLPVVQELVLPAQKFAPVRITLPMPNGSLTGDLTLPDLPEIRRSLVGQCLIPTPDGLFLVAGVSGFGSPVGVEGGNSQTVEDGWKHAMTRLKLTSFQSKLPEATTVVLGVGVMQKLFSEINAMPVARRTVSFQGVSHAGDIYAKTGGPPFGNGFKVYPEGATRTTAQGSLGAINPEFGENVITLTTQASISVNSQLHFHGNAVQIKKRGPFGIKLIDVKVGGGVGTSFGVTASAQAHKLKGVLKASTDANDLSFELVEPAEVPVRFDIGGFPGEVENWLKNSVKAKLPVGTPLATLKLPSVVLDELKSNDPTLQLAKILKLETSEPKVQITPHYLILSTKVAVNDTVPTP